MRLRLAQMEEVDRLLRGAIPLAQLQEERSSGFASEVRAWLAELERVLAANGLALASTVSALRSRLVSVDHGVVPSGVVLRGRVTRRRVAYAVGAEVLQRATETVSESVREDRARFAEAERLLGHAVALMGARGYVPPNDNGADRTGYLRALWSAGRADPEIASALTHVEGLVGVTDALVSLDRCLSRA